MLVLFLVVIASGHIYCVSFILIVNVGIFSEIISLKRNSEKDKQVPFFYLINWYSFIFNFFKFFRYFFFVGVFFFYGKLFTSKLTKFVLQNQWAYVIFKESFKTLFFLVSDNLSKFHSILALDSRLSPLRALFKKRLLQISVSSVRLESFSYPFDRRYMFHNFHQCL